MGIAYVMTSTTISVVLDFRPIVIPSTHPNFQQIRDLAGLPDTTEADIRPLIDIPAAISTFTGGNVTVVNGRLFYKGFEVKNNLATVILGFVKSGQPEAARPFERFLEKAFQNPDPRAVEGLYDWVVAGGLPITPDGDILAWKGVQDNYMSIRAGKRGHLRHMIGDVVSEPREETNSNPHQTCSTGIHFCSLEYLKSGGYVSGGSRIMAVAISPTDVVAFPNDYNLSKGRCCRLTVVGEVPRDQVPNYYRGAKVFSGWSAPATPVSPFAVGTQWKDGDGDVWKVVKDNGASIETQLVIVRGRGCASSTKPVKFTVSGLTASSNRGSVVLTKRA